MFSVMLISRYAVLECIMMYKLMFDRFGQSMNVLCAKSFVLLLCMYIYIYIRTIYSDQSTFLFRSMLEVTIYS